MLDFMGFPNNGSAPQVNIQQFLGDNTAIGIQWKTWVKPRGISMIHILCVGSGGGGSGGFTGVAASARGGGGGGGSSSQTTLIIPAFLIPDVLYIQAGVGGTGSASGAAGGTGMTSIVAIQHSYNAIPIANNILCVSGQAGAGGGGASSATVVGSAGAAGTAATLANMPLASLGVYNFIIGQGGAAGGAVAGGVGTNVGLPTNGACFLGGAGGSGTTSADFAGSTYNATASSLLSEYRPNGAAAAGSNNGSDGVLIQKPFYGFGGSGGASSNAGIGGAGGKGAIGCGGGGGGAGTTGGVGGNGGPGLVIITAW